MAQERSDTKPMVAMSMSDIDRRQVLAARSDPIDEVIRLF
jgi:hypothetical protein